MCRYHANFIYILEAIHEKIKVFPKTGRDLLNIVCCDTQNEACMINICGQCENDLHYALLPVTFISSRSENMVKFKQWNDASGRP